MKRRIALTVLWLSILAMAAGVWLWQDAREEARHDNTITQIAGDLSGTRADTKDPDYMPALLVGVGGLVGVVVAGSTLRNAKSPPSE